MASKTTGNSSGGAGSSSNTSSSSSSSSGGGRFRWRVDAEKHVVVWNFERRGWVKTDGDDWNIFWASKATVKSLFNPESGARLVDGQYVNHFPNHYELTRKDLMVKNIKRYKKEAAAAAAMAALAATTAGLVAGGSAGAMAGAAAPMSSGFAANSTAAAAGVSTTLSSTASTASTAHPSSVTLAPCVAANHLGATGGIAAAVATTPETLDFLPTTYTLPGDYSLFVEEFRRNPNVMWIMKPCSKAQGKGIFIINKLSQTKKWANPQRWASAPAREGYVVSRYVESPLLVGGKKFDLRMYVLVVSYRPLQAFVYREGFARFCNVKYSADADDMDNPFMHLTNVAVQKHNEDYNSKHGGKWSLANLRLWVEATRGRGCGDKLLFDIHAVMLHSLRAVQHVIINDPHCFECYGYDVIVDDALKPWLVEVNASPSLTTTTREDRDMKSRLLRDVLELAVLSDAPDQRRAAQTPVLRATNGFQWLINEAALLEAERLRDQQQQQRKAARSRATQWR